MMKRRRYDSAFVPAHVPWYIAVWNWLFPPRTKRHRETVQRDRREFWNEVPETIWELRKRGTEAHQLLRRYIEGKPTSRRAWAKDGLSESAWNRARRMLISAKIIDRQGNLLYSKRDAQLRLDVYLKKQERRARENQRYLPP